MRAQLDFLRIQRIGVANAAGLSSMLAQTDLVDHEHTAVNQGRAVSWARNSN